MNDISIMMRKMCIFAERNMAEEHLGFPEQIVLMYLQGQGPSSQEQMACFFELDKGAVSKTLNKMEQKGLITRSVNARDKREKIVDITPAAEQIIGRMTEVLSAWEHGVYEGISEEEAEITERCVERMAENANKMVGGTAR